MNMTLEQAAQDMRDKINSGKTASSWNLGTYVDAIDAHLAKAATPIGQVVKSNDLSTPSQVVYFLPNGNLPAIGTMIYAGSPPSAEPAQPVEAVDIFAPIPEAVEAPTPELWRAYEAFNNAYMGFNTQQALRSAINGVLAERAALAHPRHTGDGQPSAWMDKHGNVIRGDHKEPAGDAYKAFDQPLYKHAAPTVEQAGEVVGLTYDVWEKVTRAHTDWIWEAKGKLGLDPIPGAARVEAFEKRIRPILQAAITQPRAVGVPDGWKSTPREPTPEMFKACDAVIQGYGAKLVWMRMHDASPAPGKGDEP